MIVYLARDIPAFLMYCVYGESRSSLFIESTGLYDTDSMIYIGRILRSSTISVGLAQARTMTIPGASGTVVYYTKKWLSVQTGTKSKNPVCSGTVSWHLWPGRQWSPVCVFILQEIFIYYIKFKCKKYWNKKENH